MKKFALLNVVCQPHPDGIYQDLFSAVGRARKGVQYYGERYASLSPISSIRDGVFTARLATWIEPDRSAKTIIVDNLEQQRFEESGVVIPRGVGLNSRVFNVAFNVSHHCLVVELDNDEGQSISPAQASRAVRNLLNASILDSLEEVSVYVRTKADAVDSVLRVPEIRKIRIDLRRPNPEDYSEEEEDILRELDEENARQRVTELTRARDRKTLTLNARHRAMARVAKDNGEVSVSGRDANGERVTLSTKEMPLIVRRGTGEDVGSVLVRNVAVELNEQRFE